MKLQPISNTTEAPYPARKANTFRVMGRWVRRIGAAVAAASCLWIVGCQPVTEGGVPTPPSFFVCSDEDYEGAQTLDYPGDFPGGLCHEGGALGSMEIHEPVSLAFVLDNGARGGYLDATASIYDPGGVLVAEVDANEPEVVVTFEPGLYEVSVSEGESTEINGFTLHIAVDR